MIHRRRQCGGAFIPPLVLCDPCFERSRRVREPVARCDRTDWPAAHDTGAAQRAWGQAHPARRQDELARYGQEMLRDSRRSPTQRLSGPVGGLGTPKSPASRVRRSTAP